MLVFCQERKEKINKIIDRLLQMCQKESAASVSEEEISHGSLTGSSPGCHGLKLHTHKITTILFSTTFNSNDWLNLFHIILQTVYCTPI